MPSSEDHPFFLTNQKPHLEILGIYRGGARLCSPLYCGVVTFPPNSSEERFALLLQVALGISRRKNLSVRDYRFHRRDVISREEVLAELEKASLENLACPFSSDFIPTDSDYGLGVDRTYLLRKVREFERKNPLAL
jgi:hypothetical protein